MEEAEEPRSHDIVCWDLGLGGERARPKSCLNLEPRRSGLNNFRHNEMYFVQCHLFVLDWKHPQFFIQACNKYLKILKNAPLKYKS